MAFGECIECFQLGPLPLPVLLPGSRVRFLHADEFHLLLDCFVETSQELLVIAPFGLPQSILYGLPESRGVLVAVLQQHGELFFGVAFRCNQPGEALRCFVAAGLHQFEDSLQGKGSGHNQLADWYKGSAGSLAQQVSATWAKQAEQLSDAAREVGALAQVLLQQSLKARIDGNGLVELRIRTRGVCADADQIARTLVAREEALEFPDVLQMSWAHQIHHRAGNRLFDVDGRVVASVGQRA